MAFLTRTPALFNTLDEETTRRPISYNATSLVSLSLSLYLVFACIILSVLRIVCLSVCTSIYLSAYLPLHMTASLSPHG